MKESVEENPKTQVSPLQLHREYVNGEWIDYNGHMNLAYYVLAFDHATDAFFDHLGLGVDYLKSNNCSTFTLEAHITYDRELMANDPLRFETQLLDHDAKRIHYIHMMYHEEKGYLASTNELISLHVNMTKRRSTPLPNSVTKKLETIMKSHKLLPRPKQTGQVISLAK